MANCLYDINNPKLRQLVIRKNYDDLKDWIDRSREFFRAQKPVFVMSNKEIQFPSGAKIILGHLKDDAAYTKYQGHEYQRILIEELTHIPSLDMYMKLISSCRSTVDGLQARVFATTNPGEVGHRWVKSRFIDVASPEEIFTDPTTGRTRVFIPARVEDNPTLMEKDPDYVHFLEGLPDDVRARWREGSWEEVTIRGAYYAQDIEKAKKEGRICILPFDRNLPRKFYFDLGISKTDSMCVWCTQEFGKEIRVIKSWQFFETSLTTVLTEIFRSEYGAYIEMVYFPHDIRQRELTTGETRLETAIRICRQYKASVSVVPAMNPEERVHMMREIFPRLFFHEKECADGIEALQNYRKEWNDKYQTFENRPVHDWASHYSDAAGMIGVSTKMEIPVEERQGLSLQRRISNELSGKPLDYEEEFDDANPFGF